MRTSILLAAIAQGFQLRRDPHLVESAHAKDVANGGGGHVERACASYLHECTAALAEEPCSHRSVEAMEAAAGALPHCGGETFGSYTGGNWATSFKGYQDEFQRRCVGLCDPKCAHGTCTGLKQCTCDEGWHGPTCEFVVCAEPGCGTGYCGNDGVCGAFEKDKCSASTSEAVVEARCLGKQSCLVDASCAEFHERLQGNGAFCWDVVKHLSVKVTCKKQQPLGTAARPPPPPARRARRAGSCV